MSTLNSEAIRVLSISDQSRFIIEVEVGNLPPSRIKERVEKVKELVVESKLLPEGSVALYVPMRNGVPGIRVTALELDENPKSKDYEI